MALLCRAQLGSVRFSRHQAAKLRHQALPSRANTWRGVCHVAQIVEAPVQSVSRISALTEELVTEEAALAQMFESGRPMPKAAVVNYAREKIAALKAELAALVAGVEPPPRPAQGTVQANPQQFHPAEIPAVDTEALERARLLLDGVTHRREPDWSPMSDSDIPVQLAILESENNRLRTVATALIRRQQQLEELVAGLLAPRID